MNYVNYCSLNVAAIVLIHRSSLLGYGKIKTCNRVRRTGLPLGRLFKVGLPKGGLLLGICRPQPSGKYLRCDLGPHGRRPVAWGCLPPGLVQDGVAGLPGTLPVPSLPDDWHGVQLVRCQPGQRQGQLAMLISE